MPEKGISSRDAVKNVLGKLYHSTKGLTAEAVVQEAKKPSSPLHPLFEWDDGKAAEQWRLHRARNLIRAVRVIKVDGAEEILFHVPKITKGPGAYKIGSALVGSLSDFELALEEASKKLAAAKQAVQDLRDLVDQAEDDRLAMILLAVESMQTAQSALARVH